MPLLKVIHWSRRKGIRQKVLCFRYFLTEIAPREKTHYGHGNFMYQKFLCLILWDGSKGQSEKRYLSEKRTKLIQTTDTPSIECLAVADLALPWSHCNTQIGHIASVFRMPTIRQSLKEERNLQVLENVYLMESGFSGHRSVKFHPSV